MEDGKDKKVLITGGAGFIGVNLAAHFLRDNDYDIVVLDNLSEGSKDILDAATVGSKDRLEFVEGDILNREDVSRAMDGVGAVVHLAAHTGVIPSQEEPEKDAMANVIGTLRVLECMRSSSANKFVFASSGAPLGRQEPPLDESKVPQPISPYGASKLAGEAYCGAYAGSFNLQTVVLRFSSVYGPWSSHKKSAMHAFIRGLIHGEPLIIYGDGEQTRDFIYVEDVCSAISKTLASKSDDNFNLFQLGTGTPTTINRVFEIIKKELSRHGYSVPEPIYEKERAGEMKRNYTNISKAKGTLGFDPAVSIEEGIKRTVDWYIERES